MPCFLSARGVLYFVVFSVSWSTAPYACLFFCYFLFCSIGCEDIRAYDSAFSRGINGILIVGNVVIGLLTFMPLVGGLHNLV